MITTERVGGGSGVWTHWD